MRGSLAMTFCLLYPRLLVIFLCALRVSDGRRHQNCQSSAQPVRPCVTHTSLCIFDLLTANTPMLFPDSTISVRKKVRGVEEFLKRKAKRKLLLPPTRSQERRKRRKEVYEMRKGSLMHPSPILLARTTGRTSLVLLWDAH